MKKVLNTFIALLALIVFAITAAVPSFAVDLSRDGEYTVNVYLVQKEKDEKTPASNGILEQAKIVVKNGKATMFIDTQPVKVAGITATLQSMTVFPGTEEVNGKEAKVVSRNAKGNPNKFSFELPHTKKFIDIRVYTGLAFPKSIGSRLKVDWTSLKLVKEVSTVKTTKVEKSTNNTEPEKTNSASSSKTIKVTETASAKVTTVKDAIAKTSTTLSQNVTETESEVTDKNNVDTTVNSAQKSENESEMSAVISEQGNDGNSTDSLTTQSTLAESKTIKKIIIPAVAVVAVIAVVAVVAVVIVVRKKHN